MEIKLFVDDTRPRPKGYEFAGSYKEAVESFELFGDFDVVSLDFSLGNDEPTGLDVLKYMKENGKSPKLINIHSNHIEGMKLMKEYAEENFPNSKVTMNTLYK